MQLQLCAEFADTPHSLHNVFCLGCVGNADKAFTHAAKGAAWNAYNMSLFQQAVAEGAAIEAKGTDIREQIECALRLREANTGDLLQLCNGNFSSLTEHFPEVFGQFPVLQGINGSILGSGIDAGNEVLLALGHPVDQCLGAGCIAHTPAAHGIGLGKAVDNNGTLTHTGECGNRHRLGVFKDQRVINLIGDDQKIQFAGNFRNLFQILSGQNMAGGGYWGC